MKDRWSGQTRSGGVYLALTVAAARTSPPAPAHIDRLCIVSVALLAPVTLDTAQLLTSFKAMVKHEMLQRAARNAMRRVVGQQLTQRDP